MCGWWWGGGGGGQSHEHARALTCIAGDAKMATITQAVFDSDEMYRGNAFVKDDFVSKNTDELYAISAEIDPTMWQRRS